MSGPVIVSNIKQNASGASSAPTGYFASQAYFICDTAADVSAKTAYSPSPLDVTVTSAAVADGLTIYVKFINSNTAANPTFQIYNASPDVPAPACPIITSDSATYSRGVGASIATSWYPGSIVSLTYYNGNWMLTDFKADLYYETYLATFNDIDFHYGQSPAYGDYVSISNIQLSAFSANRPSLDISQIVVDNASGTANNGYATQYNFIRSPNSSFQQYPITLSGAVVSQYFDTQHDAGAVITRVGATTALYIFSLVGGTYDTFSMFYASDTHITFYFS